MKRNLAEIIFWLHLLVVAFWVGLFFVPLNWWKGRVVFHFFLTLCIVGHQFLWGAVISPWTKHIRPVCILTTFMQLLRGEKLSDERNYAHSWTAEFFKRIGLGAVGRGATVMTFTILLLVTLQFIFFR